MNYGKQQALYQGLTAVAKRVYDAVPIGETWSAHQVTAEMRRVAGHSPEHKVVAGCLGNLVHIGMVQEPERGSFRRVAVRAPQRDTPIKIVAALAAPVQPSPAIQAPMTLSKPKEKTAIDKISDLAERVGALASSCKQISDELLAVGIQLEQDGEANKAALEQLRQLKAIFKD
ncbi:hypothetical protein [Tardiphaga sp. 862_B3_N1_1]|uniref:hypothetical protein n=1 Tax=Tardiphaga sp. 862_B3_N1_1 TaxID=3240763 RepID=UPI003F8B6A4F